MAGATAGGVVGCGAGGAIGYGIGSVVDWALNENGNEAEAEPKPDREQKPENCPTGTKPIDKDKRLDREKIHKIKGRGGLNAGPKDWVGIDSDGNIWTNEGGTGVNNGHYTDYIN